MKLSKLDHVILALPILGVLDVFSAFYATWRGYPIELFEGGLFASYFAFSGMLYFYMPLYFAILGGMTALLLFIKREVASTMSFDKFMLLLLVVTIWILEATLVKAIVYNFMLASNRFVFGGALTWIVYLCILIAILTFAWDELKELFEMSDHEE